MEKLFLIGLAMLLGAALVNGVSPSAPFYTDRMTPGLSQDTTQDRSIYAAVDSNAYYQKPYGYSAYRSPDYRYPQGSAFGFGGYGGVGSYGGAGIISTLFSLLIIPLLVLAGISLFMPVTITLPNTGRQSSSSPYTEEASLILHRVMKAFESEDCMHRTVCDAATYVKSLNNSVTTVLGSVEKLAPKKMAPYLDILREAAKSRSPDFCRKYSCPSVDEQSITRK